VLNQSLLLALHNKHLPLFPSKAAAIVSCSASYSPHLPLKSSHSPAELQPTLCERHGLYCGQGEHYGLSHGSCCVPIACTCLSRLVPWKVPSSPCFHGYTHTHTHTHRNLKSNTHLHTKSESIFGAIQKRRRSAGILQYSLVCATILSLLYSLSIVNSTGASVSMLTTSALTRLLVLT